MKFYALSAVVLVLGLATAAGASDLARAARFGQLHGATPALATDGDRSLRGGLTITGEKITLENGALSATIQKVAHPEFVMKGVAGQARMPFDQDLLTDPINTAINNILVGSTFTIAHMDNLRSGDRKADRGVSLSNIKLIHNLKFIKGSLKAPLVSPSFSGRSGWDKATKKMTVVVDAVVVGGFSVPLGVAFAAMKNFVRYSFVTFDKPRVIIDLSSFLPHP